MSRKRSFLIGCLFISLAYAFPLGSAVLLQSVWGAIVLLAGFVGSVYILYRFTILKVKRKYPGIPPTGQPDIYTRLSIPRPIYEDMEQHPWLFKKRKQKWIERIRTKKVKKKH